MKNLRKGEKIVVVKRRHYMVFFLELLPFIFMSLLVLFAIVYVLLQGVPQGILEVADLSVANIDYAVVFFLFLFLLFLWSFAFMIVTKYYLDCWIITDRRTIHTELRGFFSRFIPVFLTTIFRTLLLTCVVFFLL